MVILMHIFHRYLDLIWGFRGFLVLGLSVCEWQPLAPAVMVLRGLTFQPAILRV